VRPGIPQDAAPGGPGVVPPPAERGIPAEALAQKHRGSILPGVEQFLGTPHGRHAQHLVRDPQDNPRFPRCREQLIALGDGVGHRLLQEEVLVGEQQVPADRQVEVVR